MQFTHPWQRNDWIQLEMARRIAAHMRENPSLIRNARVWMNELRAKGRDYVAHREWEEILDRSTFDEVLELLTMENDEGQRLRSSHPFKGIITEAERTAIIENAFAS
jgi:hypothetical protein